MKKVIIIDDEPLARSIVKEMLKNYPEFEIIEECSNGFEGVKAIEKHSPDLVFLDVQMPKINGFEMLELLDQKPTIIFTTAFDEYALKAFEVNALDYLLKPFDSERFNQAIQKFIQRSSAKQNENQEFITLGDHLNRIVIKDGSDIKIIPVTSVNYLEAYDDYVKIHTDDKVYLKNATMNYYEKNLEKTMFSRIHRSYIINVNRLTKIEGFEKNSYRAILQCGARVPISRSSYKQLKESLGL